MLAAGIHQVPIRARKAVSSTKEGSEARGGIVEETILLVDDEADIREVLGIALEDMGCSVLVAENGEEAIALYEEHTPA